MCKPGVELILASILYLSIGYNLEGDGGQV